jgi:transcriptional regulator with XRE-family HTH domain
VPVGDELKGEIESRWRDLGEFIREQRNLGQLSLRKLSEQAGVSNPYLSQIERGLRHPSAEILRQIARALEISSEELYVLAEIRREPDLTEDQKKTLIHIYESFRRENAGAIEAEAAE